MGVELLAALAHMGTLSGSLGMYNAKFRQPVILTAACVRDSSEHARIYDAQILS